MSVAQKQTRTKSRARPYRCAEEDFCKLFRSIYNGKQNEETENLIGKPNGRTQDEAVGDFWRTPVEGSTKREVKQNAPNTHFPGPNRCP